MPLAHDRLAAHPDGSLTVRLKTRWRDGTTHIVMQPRDLIDRIVPLIPPPRAHQVRYHGILAPAASLRDSVVPASAQPESQGTTTQPLSDAGPPEPAPAATNDAMKPRRTRWAALLQRVFAVDALACPRCGATLRLLAAIEDPSVARAILGCLALPARAPPPGTGQPTASQPDPDPDPPFEFDQRTDYEET